MQKTENFTGIWGTRNQDTAVVESMGPIMDRTKERLGHSATSRSSPLDASCCARRDGSRRASSRTRPHMARSIECGRWIAWTPRRISRSCWRNIASGRSMGSAEEDVRRKTEGLETRPLRPYSSVVSTRSTNVPQRLWSRVAWLGPTRLWRRCEQPADRGA